MSDRGSVNNITLPVYLKLMKKINGKVSKINATDIESLSADVLNELKCGDIITKQTGEQKHAYIVTYKQEQHGICLSYFDGSGYIETISYDYTDGHWVFNSKDVFNAEDIPTGTKLYLHHLTGRYNNVLYTIHIISESPNNFVLITSGGPPRVGDGHICVQNGINESVDGDYVCYPIVKKVYSTGFSFNIVKIHLSDGVVTFVNTTTPTNITWGTDTVTPL